MAEPIDFWFDFSSPYGYLMSERIDDLASRFGRKVRWHPILLGIVFRATASAPLTLQHPAKAAYALADFERSARFMGIPYRHPTKFPLPTQNAARAYYWLHGEECALARRFAHAVYRALFVEDRDISAPATVLEIGTKLGVDRGNVQGAERKMPISEVELELISGNIADLFGLTRQLQTTLDLRPAIASKAERGYALFLGEAPAPFKARTAPIDASMTPVQAFRAIALQRLQAQAQIVGAGQRIQLRHVGSGDLGAGIFDIAGRQCLADPRGDPQSFIFPVAGDQCLTQIVLPVAQYVSQTFLQIAGIRLKIPTGPGPDNQVKLRQRRSEQEGS